MSADTQLFVRLKAGKQQRQGQRMHRHRDVWEMGGASATSYHVSAVDSLGRQLRH